MNLRLEQILPQSKHHPVLVRLNFGYIDLAFIEQARPALAHGVAVDTLVGADDSAVKDHISRSGHGRALLNPADVILVGDEADFHAVGLVGDGDGKFLRQGAHLGLFIIPKRQNQPLYLLSRQAAEHVALVVGGHALE